MVYITKFRVNDLAPSKGKQIEFNAGIASKFFEFGQDECTVTFECRSFANDSFKKTISVYLKLSPERGDYKIYQNPDGSLDLKDVFLSQLHLTAVANADDYYAIRKKTSNQYVLYYIPKDLLFSRFFPAISGDQILTADDPTDSLPQAASLGAIQKITYGAPGTGKSHKIDKCTNESNSIRVTFHPDTDYAAFVGAYKPTMESTDKGLLTLEELKTVLQSLKDRGETRPEQKLGAEFWRSFEKLTPADVKSILENDSMYAEVMKGVAVGEYLTRIENGGKQIIYSFVPQAFMKAYVEAWRRYTNAGLQGDAKTYYLVIEEINRGNCAQIFGDLFQLLDRADNGFSAYAITPDDDIQKFLEADKVYKLADISLSEDIKKVTETGEKIIATAADIKSGKKLVLPPNLCIWATMNTSDQSLFPIDSAFKRRWDWEYVPITEGKDKDGKPLGWKIAFDVPKKVEGAPDSTEEFEYDWWEFVKRVNEVIDETTHSEDKKLGYFFVKPMEEKVGGGKKKVISAKRFLEKVIFYLWNDVFKDYGLDKIFTKDGKAVAFHQFFDRKTGAINVVLIKEFIEKLPEVKE
jgi:hypothetical protein